MLTRTPFLTLWYFFYNFLYNHAVFHITMRTSVYNWWLHHQVLINIECCSLARLKARYLSLFLNTISSTFCFNRCHYAICWFLFINLCTRVVLKRKTLRDLELFVLTTGTMVVWHFSCFIIAVLCCFKQFVIALSYIFLDHFRGQNYFYKYYNSHIYISKLFIFYDLVSCKNEEYIWDSKYCKKKPW